MFSQKSETMPLSRLYSVPHRERPHTHLGHEKPEAGDPAHQRRGALLTCGPHLLQPAGPSQVHESRNAP